jgi:membrane-associated phospholipid phosphatase
MRFSEFLALGYFLMFLAAALGCLLRGRPAWRTAGISALGIAFVSLAPQAPDLLLSDVFIPLRDWWLLAALPLAYWTPAPLAGRPNQRLEQWLLRVDEKLGLNSLRASEFFELAYLLVYPMVPAGLLASSAGELFWRAVLIAVLPCYGLLPLLPTRPPRALAGASTAVGSIFRVANVGFLRVFGNAWNTLPSGHAAGAAAVAVVVWRSGSSLAPIFVVLAAGIAIGTVRGRYHYAVDTLLGVALGIVAGLAAWR